MNFKVLCINISKLGVFRFIIADILLYDSTYDKFLILWDPMVDSFADERILFAIFCFEWDVDKKGPWEVLHIFIE